MLMVSIPACGGDPILEQAARSEEPSVVSGTDILPTPVIEPGAPPAVDLVPGIPAEPAPGVPSEPGPGSADAASPAAGDDQVSVQGRISAQDWAPGVTIRIDVFDGDQRDLTAPRPSVVGMARISAPGAYTVSVAESAGAVWVGAYADLDGDGWPSHTEPVGWFSGNPLDLSSTVTGVDLSLAVEAPPPTPE